MNNFYTLEDKLIILTDNVKDARKLARRLGVNSVKKITGMMALKLSLFKCIEIVDKEELNRLYI